ncbi:MAG: hypothetical protein IMF17_02295 [Proteobacteria bacterium]|nr:hypothetical protein [Pseudomonadota bacterium]
MKQISIVKPVLKLALVGVVALQVACSTSTSSTPPADASISGTISAAPVNGADVSVVDGNGNVVVDPVPTDADGQYSLVIPNGSLGQDLIIKSTGGTFIDEATGNQDVVAGEMLAYMSANSITDGSSVSATPGSTIIAKLVLDTANGIATKAEAEVVFANAFGYTPDVSVEPADATAPVADATDASKLAGLRAAAFSQLTMDLGLLSVEQFDLLAALVKDLADGSLDGESAGSPVEIIVGEMLPIDVQNRFTTALLNFHDTGLMGDVHGNDQTGLTSDMIGVIPFAKVALTSNYKIEYVPGMMDAMEGKTMFTLRITDAADQAVTGLTAGLMPMMHMSAHKHSTPNLDCVPAITDGDYDCTVYYLMPSVMATGMSMGYWELTVMAAMGESTTFYPKVMMAMGDTPKVTLKGQAGSDMIAGMLGDMSRNYILFNESLTGTGNARKFKMFIAAMESMMSYPPVYVGAVLNVGDMDHELTVSTMTVEVSTVAVPAAPSDWKTADEDPSASGYWLATGLTDLVDGTEGNIHVRLKVNGEVKTIDGMAPSGANEYTTYTVTPGGM